MEERGKKQEQKGKPVGSRTRLSHERDISMVSGRATRRICIKLSLAKVSSTTVISRRSQSVFA